MQRSQITTGFADAALAFIDASARDSKPFYVNLWPDDVHSPFWPQVEQWRDGKRGLYHAVLESMDRQLGKLFDRIRSDPALRDNTLILVCSDNGPEVGAGSAGEFRGTKGMLYEGGVRSPLVVWGPGFTNTKKLAPPTARRIFPRSMWHPRCWRSRASPLRLGRPSMVFPCAKRCSAAPMLRATDRSFSSSPDRAAFAGDDKLPDLAVRDGRWKLLCTYDGSAQQLYDLDADPAEKKNLAASQPAETARLAAAVVAWHRSLPADNGATYRPRATKKKS